MRTLMVDSHETTESPVAAALTPREEAKLRIYRLPERLQSGGIQPFKNAGFLEVEVPQTAEEFKPGTLVKILAPAAMYLGAVVERVAGLLIVEVDLSTEYTPL